MQFVILVEPVRVYRVRKRGAGSGYAERRDTHLGGDRENNHQLNDRVDDLKAYAAKLRARPFNCFSFYVFRRRAISFFSFPLLPHLLVR
jgi:hypothetical protein